MKQKIIITGAKVHDVGYRPFLAEKAMDLSPKGFDVYNDEVDGRQAVIALIEGDERKVKRFIEIIQNERPPLAKVYEMKIEDYTDEVMPSWQAATMTLVKQSNKAVPILQDMSVDIKNLNKGMGDLKEGMGDLNKGMGDLNKGMGVLIEETKSLHEDMVERSDARFARIESDIAAIKTRLEMT